MTISEIIGITDTDIEYYSVSLFDLRNLRYFIILKITLPSLEIERGLKGFKSKETCCWRFMAIYDKQAKWATLFHSWPSEVLATASISRLLSQMYKFIFALSQGRGIQEDMAEELGSSPSLVLTSDITRP